MINKLKKKYAPIGQTWSNLPTSFRDTGNAGTAMPIDPSIISGYNPRPTTLFQDATTIVGQNGSNAFPGKIFSKFIEGEDIVPQQTELVTGGVWSSGVATLSTHWSGSSLTNAQRQYYIDIFDGNPALTSSVAQYSIAYGHALGSGSNSVGQLNDSPSRAIYSQYKQLLLAPGTNRFTTQGSSSTDSIYVINFKRNRLKERLDVGNFEIPLQTITGRTQNASGSVTASGDIYTLIDDSSITANPVVGPWGRVYNLVSGSITNGVSQSLGTSTYYGQVYPDYGCIILDGNILDSKLGFKTNLSSSSEANNHFTLFRSISSSCTQNNPSTSDKFGFTARNSEKITSMHYFVRVKNNEYNYSNNPSYITGSTGDIAQPTFFTDPVTYITTVGLYNNNNELLAVAKVSKPILKSFSRETLIRVKLDF